MVNIGDHQTDQNKSIFTNEATTRELSPDRCISRIVADEEYVEKLEELIKSDFEMPVDDTDFELSHE